MTITTVTLNPAVDQTIVVDHLHKGTVNRAQSVHFNAGGKGVNVASCLADWGSPSVTVTGLLGRGNATSFEDMFHTKGITDNFIRVAGLNRTNIKIVDDSDTTDLNLPGIEATSETLLKVCQSLTHMTGTLVLAGSLPTNCPQDHYATMMSGLAASNTRIILDASGAALKAALNAEIQPFCIKPNWAELADWVGHPLKTKKEVLDEAKNLWKRGIKLVVVSMGSKGALFLSREGAVIACLKAPSVSSTVGAGDAMVAGIAAALEEGADLERTARLATAFAVAKLGCLGPNLPKKEIVENFSRNVAVIRAEGEL